MSNKWTPEQQAAIDLNGQILVAAAAGSGKTAVLVERLIKRITNPSNRIDVDKFLVVTFTKAAASEMRERVGRTIDDTLFKLQDPEEIEQLLRQRSLLNRSHITTLHSFCMELIRKHFFLLDLDPAFRVADQAESEILRQDVVQELFESLYEEGDKEFENLVDAFGSDRDDNPLMGLVLNLHEFAHSQVDPRAWLENLYTPYQLNNVDAITQSPWGVAVRKGLFDRVNQSRILLERALNITYKKFGPVQYSSILQNEIAKIDLLEKALELGTWSEVQEKFHIANDFERLPPSKSKKKNDKKPDDLATEELEKLQRDKAKDLRDQAKAILSKLKEELFLYPIRDQIQSLNAMGRMVQKLASITLTFAYNYLSAKHTRNIVDFSDLEHFALHLLQGEGGPTEIAENLREYFVEVLVDEYQDINPVQEKILQLVSRVESDNPNLFMVGDVKQSIYRFRMADPTLFLNKYLNFPHLGQNPINEQIDSSQHFSANLVIDLNKNFRSRIEVVQGVNFLFRQIMTRSAGEVPYDDKAALQYGASYIISQPDLKTAEGPIELHLFDPVEIRNSSCTDENKSLADNQDFSLTNLEEADNQPISEDLDKGLEDLETARIEARLVGQRIKTMVESSEFQVYDKKLNNFRSVRYSDIVVLMRSYSTIAPIYVEEFQNEDIPVYAETNSGYFSSSEVETILSLLKVIDNPRQDIPLAAVLRSPIVGLNGAELGKIRAIHKHGDFYEALALAVWASFESLDSFDSLSPNLLLIEEIKNTLSYHHSKIEILLSQAKEILDQASDLKEKIIIFWKRLQQWRQFARRNSLVDLISRLYSDTGFLAFVGTLPNGVQRQANLKVLYDRASKFEATHFRGLFRFLRFLERFQDQGKDMGTARTLGETEDVIRIITVHSSKGLEFPVVFVVGLGTKFNTNSLKGNLLLHSSLGVGVPILDIENNVKYPSFIQYALKQRLWQESLAEEMRILYVALTRAKERLVLYGGLKNLYDSLEEWLSVANNDSVSFSDGQLKSAKSFLDWIGPALARHSEDLFGIREHDMVSIPEANSAWKVIVHSNIKFISNDSKPSLVKSNELILAATDIAETKEKDGQKMVENIFNEQENLLVEIDRRLSWQYPFINEVKQVAKTSVTELKRLYAWYSDPNTISEEKIVHFKEAIIKRPKFIQEEKILTPAEKGTALHTALQHLPFEDLNTSWKNLNIKQKYTTVEDYLQSLYVREILRIEQVQSIYPEVIIKLLDSPLGARLMSADEVLREVPFTILFTPQGYNYPLLVQGVIDALILDKNRHEAELLDYKTDLANEMDVNPEQLFIKKYAFQLAIYTEAVESLLGIQVTKTTIYSSSLGKEVALDLNHSKRNSILKQSPSL